MATTPRFDRCFNPYNLANHLKTRNLRKANDFIKKELNMYGDYVLCIDCKMKVYASAKHSKSVGDNVDNVDNNQNVDDDIACEVNVRSDDENSERQGDSCEGSCNLSLGHASQATALLKSFESLSFSSDNFQSQPIQSSSASEVSIETQLPVVNQALRLLNESPVLKKKLRDGVYLDRKVNQITRNLIKLFGLDDNGLSDLNVNLADFQDIIERLKAKFNDQNSSTAEKIRILTILPSRWSE
ncbi:Protein of unknown function [Cotesia congregata]|uniref:Uncharacterized protein n=1 Tax=Cotesia congregata TaxID=51543 RepID=A0A8J2H6I0_COTCN|nr:Protein of unknown function [Cotesia congregata]